MRSVRHEGFEPPTFWLGDGAAAAGVMILAAMLAAVRS